MEIIFAKIHMTKLEALTELAAKVEAGEWSSRRQLATDAGFDLEAIIDAVRAYHGSLDAANALHEAVLPGWHWSMESEDKICAVYKNPMNDDGHAHLGKSPIPARAWLLAIIRALIAQEVDLK
jgi:hypothetical protein